jgi:hypothetical protein
MRTQEEIDRQIEGLEKMKESLPERNYFGENNWLPIDAQIDILNGADYEDYADEEYSIESAADKARDWMDKNDDEDLFESD